MAVRVPDDLMPRPGCRWQTRCPPVSRNLIIRTLMSVYPPPSLIRAATGVLFQHSYQQNTLPGFCFIHDGLWLKKPYFHLEVNISNLDFFQKKTPTCKDIKSLPRRSLVESEEVVKRRV